MCGIAQGDETALAMLLLTELGAFYWATASAASWTPASMGR
ncbi:MAG TPA: hypothetical protein VFZ73_08795 [Gemmatimonadaceae bacterium]